MIKKIENYFSLNSVAKIMRSSIVSLLSVIVTLVEQNITDDDSDSLSGFILREEDLMLRAMLLYPRHFVQLKSGINISI